VASSGAASSRSELTSVGGRATLQGYADYDIYADTLLDEWLTRPIDKAGAK
jgi:hypothetical protein